MGEKSSPCASVLRPGGSGIVIISRDREKKRADERMKIAPDCSRASVAVSFSSGLKPFSVCLLPFIAFYGAPLCCTTEGRIIPVDSLGDIEI